MQGPIAQEYGHIEAPTKSIEGSKPRKLRAEFFDLTSSVSDAWTRDIFRYLRNMAWVARRKLDGVQIRILWDGDRVVWNGKTNRSDKFSPAVEEYLKETFVEEIFEEKFGRDKLVILFGELMGPKIQNNELGLPRPEVFLFDIQVNGVFYSRKAVENIARAFFSCQVVDDLFQIEDNLVSLITACQAGELNGYEGIVCTPEVEMYDNQKKRVICKIKQKDYA